MTRWALKQKAAITHSEDQSGKSKGLRVQALHKKYFANDYGRAEFTNWAF